MELTTHVEIDASSEEVWGVLVDFDRYHEWNPFMRVAGRANENAHLHVELFLPGGRATRFRPTVTHVDPGRELRWLGHLWTPGLFDGEHRFVLTPLDGGSRTSLTHAESMSGVLAPIVWRFVGAATERGFETMNTALKARVESMDFGNEGGDRVDDATAGKRATAQNG